MIEIIGDAPRDKSNGSKRVYYKCECGRIGETRASRAVNQKWCAVCSKEKSRLLVNKYEVIGDFAHIDVSTEKFPNSVCIIDARNINKVIDGKGRWFAANFCTSVIYAVRNSRGDKMHRQIMGADDHNVIDHRDGNGLNNTEENIIVCKQEKNMRNKRMTTRNKSGVNGVCWHKAMKKWHVQAGVNGKKFNLGFFQNFEDASRAREEFNKNNDFSNRHGKNI